MSKNLPNDEEDAFIIEHKKIVSNVPLIISAHQNYFDLRQPSFLEEIDCATTYEVSCSIRDINA